MPRILFNDRWFEELAPTSRYEASFESALMNQAPALWPEYIAVRFKCTVSSPEGSAKADFALIERQHREWWVGEVEMAHHPLDSHVLPQVRILASASYGPKEVECLCANQPSLNRRRVTDMLKGRQPKVLVVVNTPRPDWVIALSRFDALLAVVEIFRSDRNEFLFRVNGRHPVGLRSRLSICRFDRMLPRWLIVESPAALGGTSGERFVILWEGRATDWVRHDIADTVYLCATGMSPLPAGRSFEVLKRPDGTLEFQEFSKPSEP